MKTTRRASLSTQALAISLCALASVSLGAPGDAFMTAAPVLGADPPKARAIGDGDATVSTQTGALQYSFPINGIPPGRQGMVPQLSLNYSSQGATYGGIASGWSLGGVPEIQFDTSDGLLYLENGTGPDIERWVSTLAGGQRLIPVTEPVAPDTGVVETFRAEHDSSYARYERMAPGHAWRWQVRTLDGAVHYFGDSSHLESTNAYYYAPLTRTVDRFSNVVGYHWKRVANGAELVLDHVSYGANTDASLPDHARVRFEWTPSPTCTGTDLPVGASVDMKLNGRVSGSQTLVALHVEISETPSSWREVRRYALGYDTTALNDCNGLAAPLRLLTSIQEIGVPAAGNLYPLPAITFGYGPRQRQLSNSKSFGFNLQGNQLPGNVLTWGARFSGTTWPTVEAMLLDLDGDGRQDRLYMDNSGGQCTARWQKNQGTFFEAVTGTFALPTIPWKGGTPNPLAGEGCSLAGQRSMRENRIPPSEPPHIAPACGPTGSYLAYRFTDVQNDGLPDLVAALHFDHRYYSPVRENLALFPGSIPSCTPSPGECPVLSPACMAATEQCNAERECDFDEAQVEQCLAAATGQPCGGMMFAQCEYTEEGCDIYIDCNEEPDHDACWYESTWWEQDPPDVTIDPPLGGDPNFPRADICSIQQMPFQTCGKYVWWIWDNLGNGAFAPQARTILSPVPLDADTGDSSLGSGTRGWSSSLHAITDVDGDGFQDAVVRACYPDLLEVSCIPQNWWLVFRGDGQGGFSEAPNGWPYIWVVPNGARPGTSETGSYGPSSERWMKSPGAMFDINGDSLPDLLDKTIPGAPARVYINKGTGFNTGPFATPWDGRPVMPTALDHLHRSYAHVTDTIAGWPSDAARESRIRPIDFDADGRIDWVEQGPDGTSQPLPATLRTNAGGNIAFTGAPLPTSQASLQHLRVRAYAGAVVPYTSGGAWAITSDLIDLDSDGLVDGYDASASTIMTDPASEAPLRLLNSISNGAGMTIEVKYASTQDAAVVQDDAAVRKASPRNGSVVHTLTATEAHCKQPPEEPCPDEATSYSYHFPRWNQDGQGRWGFRGYDEVWTTLPSGAVTVDKFGYDVDWSGRKVKTELFASEAMRSSQQPERMQETLWRMFGLFPDAGGVHTIKTFQVDKTWNWTCSPGQTVTTCRTQGAVARTQNVWNDLPNPPATAVLWAPATEWVMDQMAAKDATDWRKTTTYILHNTSAYYRLLPQNEYRYDYDPLAEAWNHGVARTLHVYDVTGKVEKRTQVYLDASTPAVTERQFDMITGNVTAVRKPEQYRLAQNKWTTFQYDARKLFAFSTTNEKSHVVEADFDLATGAILAKRGPNATSCGSGCTKKEETRTTIDVFGRPLEGWVSVDDATQGYRLELVARTTYLDIPPGTPTPPQQVIEERRIDYGGDWVTVERTFDGHGRPLTEKTRLFSATQPDAIISYQYDWGGRLAAFTAPDPTKNDDKVVTYSYSYDSLGRPVSLRNPDGSGVNLHYDTLTTTRAECFGPLAGACSEVPPAGDVLATTELENDVFGRLRVVRERTADETWSVTEYDYNVNDDMTHILVDGDTSTTDDDVETILVPNWVGWRLAVQRAGREWAYTYDNNGNQTSELLPRPAGALALDYTTFVTYDELDRPVLRDVAPMANDAAAQTELGIGNVVTVYDLGPNGIGRVSSVDTPILHGGMSYDAQGRVSAETRSFQLAGLPLISRTVSRTFNALGAEVDTLHADDPVDATHSLKTYDRRGLPLSTRWFGSGGINYDFTAVRNVSGKVVEGRNSWSPCPSCPLGAMIGSLYAYDQLGRVTKHTVKRSWSIGQQTIHAQQDYTYGASSEVLGLVTGLAGAPARALAFDYDPQHQLIAASDNQGYDATFGYWATGKLQSAYVDSTQPTFDLDPRDVVYDYLGSPDPEAPAVLRDQSTGTPYASYAYDLAGNVIQRWQSGAGITTYAHDGDAMRRATGVDASSEAYFYDSPGNRVLAVRRTPSGAIDRIRFWFGETELWFDGAGNVTKRWVHLSQGVPVARIENGTTIEWTHTSMLGSTLVALSTDGTSVNAGFAYGPFGEILDGVGSTSDHLRRFNGKEHDRVSGLLYYGHRFYDPLSLTWTQADPLYRFVPELAWDVPRRMALYTFSLNNPLRFVDPDGLDCGRETEGTNLAPGGCRGDANPDEKKLAESASQTAAPGPDDAAIFLLEGARDVVCLALGCNPGNTPENKGDPSGAVYDRKSTKEEVISYGTFGAGTAAGKFFGRLFGRGAGQETAGVFVRTETSTVSKVVAGSGGSIRQAVTQINAARLGQSEAVQVVTRVTEGSGRQIGGIVDLAGGAKGVIGVVQGANQPVVHIAANGWTTFARGTVSFALDSSGKVVTRITDLVLP